MILSKIEFVFMIKNLYICSMNNPNTLQEFNPVNNAEDFDVDTYLDMMTMYRDFLNEIQLDDDQVD